MHMCEEFSGEISFKIWKSNTDPVDDVVWILNKSHEINITVEWLKHKLSWGPGGMAAMAYAEGRPVGIALLGVAPYVCDGIQFPLWLSLDNYVMPKYRGRGIYTRLLSLLDEACEEEGVQWAITFPNGNSRPGFKKAGWIEMKPMWAYINIPISLNPFVMVSRFRSVSRAQSEDFVPIEQATVGKNKLTELLVFARDDRFFKFEESLDALQYRFHRLRGVGYSAIRTNDGGAIVRVGNRGPLVEVQFLTTFPRDMPNVTWRKLVKVATTEFGPDVISRISNENSSQTRALLTGFIRVKRVTTPFMKNFQQRKSLPEPVLSGIDLHLW